VLNLGFGWDRTQNVLWRLDHGEFDGLHPQRVVINIGTNNFSGTSNARENTPAEVAEGVRAICIRVRSKSPDSRIILMGVLPRGAKAQEPCRKKIAELNKLLQETGKAPGITFLDIGENFLGPGGELPRTLMGDFCHPTEQGYGIWADALKPLL
jgi:lysophospholipase L1-like esterase